MIKKLQIIIIIILLSAFSFRLSAFGAEFVSSKELIDNAALLDGKKITYKGEAVGAVITRGENYWINVNDTGNAIGVWCPGKLLEEPIVAGNYKHKGDILEITGIFNRTCPIHGGELDIHAQEIKIVKKGYLLEESLHKGRLTASLILFALAFFIVAIFRKRF